MNTINYFAQLPQELIDYIFSLCNKSYMGSGEFIRYTHIETDASTARKTYHEYTGTMKDGVPHGTGTMLRCSTYGCRKQSISGAGKIPNHMATEWLYRPFLYMIRNCDPGWQLRFMLEQ
jgi:hypothetical protein